MRMLTFAKRNTLEIVRDPLTVAFGIGFPVIVLLLLQALRSTIPGADMVPMFNIEILTPGIALFGLSFISLFSATLISKDRSTSFMMKLLASPLRPWEFICGYTLPLLPISILQTVVCYSVGFCFGLEISWRVLLAIAVLLPADIFFIALGLLFGSIFNDKQVGGICGALLTNLTAWLSGTWFELGGAFYKVAATLPFCHAVDAGRAALYGDLSEIMPELWWVIGYAVALSVLAVLVFSAKAKAD